ncbi:ORF-79 [Teiidae poxvirus 1]|nr:ORF-79 [Teiidae poxvirus 1]
MNKLLLENLFEGKALCAPVSRDDFFQIIACGAKSKFPKSLLSIYRIVPRVMTRYTMKLLSTEHVTGVIITTVYNMKKNLSMSAEDKLTKQDMERYFLSKDIEVLNLMTANTSMEDLACGRPRRRNPRRKDPVIFLAVSSPLVLVMTSKKPINTYVPDKQTDPSSDYVNISPGVAVLENYGNTYLLDVHNPSSILNLSAIYGIDGNMELKKLSNSNDLDTYQSGSLGEAINLRQFTEIFSTIKKHISLTNFNI